MIRISKDFATVCYIIRANKKRPDRGVFLFADKLISPPSDEGGGKIEDFDGEREDER